MDQIKLLYHLDLYSINSGEILCTKTRSSYLKIFILQVILSQAKWDGEKGRGGSLCKDNFSTMKHSCYVEKYTVCIHFYFLKKL